MTRPPAAAAALRIGRARAKLELILFFASRRR